MDYFGAAGDTLNTAGTEQGNWIADLLGYQEQLPKITKAELPAPAFVGPPQKALGLPWLTPAEGQQLKQKLNEQATYKFPW